MSNRKKQCRVTISVVDIQDEIQELISDSLHNYKDIVLNQQMRDSRDAIVIDGIEHNMLEVGAELIELTSTEEIHSEDLTTQIVELILLNNEERRDT